MSIIQKLALVHFEGKLSPYQNALKVTVLKGCFLNIVHFSSLLLGKKQRFKPLMLSCQ